MPRPSSIATAVLYVLFMAAVVLLMLQVRSWALRTQTTPEAQADWEAWREAANEQSDYEGPVHRSVPRADEPPVLMLMRDQFVSCLVSILVLATALFATLAFFIRGVLFGPTVDPTQAPRKEAAPVK